MAKDEYDFTSTNLASGEYDDSAHEMVIEFQNGRRYLYERVDAVMWDRLKSSPSAGRFLREHFGPGQEV